MDQDSLYNNSMEANEEDMVQMMDIRNLQSEIENQHHFIRNLQHKVDLHNSRMSHNSSMSPERETQVHEIYQSNVHMRNKYNQHLQNIIIKNKIGNKNSTFNSKKHSAAMPIDQIQTAMHASVGNINSVQPSIDNFMGSIDPF